MEKELVLLYKYFIFISVRQARKKLIRNVARIVYIELFIKYYNILYKYLHNNIYRFVDTGNINLTLTFIYICCSLSSFNCMTSKLQSSSETEFSEEPTSHPHLAGRGEEYRVYLVFRKEKEKKKNIRGYTGR